MYDRGPINEYDLGLPVPIATLEERRRGVPADVWDRLGQVKARLADLLGDRLRQVRLFGSYARNQFDDESDVDVLVLVADLRPGERRAVVDAVIALSDARVILAPLVMTVAQLDELRAGERLIAMDIDREGITV